MKKDVKPRGYWTKERCKEMALLCKTKKELVIMCNSVYTKIIKNNWFDELCSHFMTGKHPVGYWTYEKCKDVAQLCKTKKEFSKKYSRAYDICRNNKWLDELCSHMIILGNLHRRLIYIYEFSDNHVYIGLTCNSERRKKEHNESNKSPVNNHIIKTGLTPNYKELTNFIEINDAIKLEKYYIDYYKNNGYDILNINSGGQIGNILIKWYYENCKNESLKYNSRGDFQKNKSAYNKSLKNNWLDEFFPKIKLNYDICKEETKKYKNAQKLKENNSTLYNFCYKNNWLNDFFPKIEWDYLSCKEEIKKYKNTQKLKENNTTVYNLCYKNKWLEDFFPKIIYDYNYNFCKEESKKYNNRSEFRKKYEKFYRIMLKNDLLDEFFPKNS